MATRPSLPIERYQVGVVCALPDEMSAAIAMLGERHRPIAGQDRLDQNNYVLGRVHDHNVVIACLPSGVYGTVSAARVANDMLRTFTGLRFGLMVGIGGGIPNLSNDLDIRLGDVVISQPDKTYGGVVQYDLRKNLGEGCFERKGLLKPPPTMLLAALATLRADQNVNDSEVPSILADMIQIHPKLVKTGYGFPGRERDMLYCSRCDGSGSDSANSCNSCTAGKIERLTREDDHPSFWYGTIASGNELMKNASERDRIGEEFGALCVEIEAAGLMNDFPCLVIRGICDYADSHKNDMWQKYAALVAAAYAKEFLAYISPEQIKLEKPIQEVIESLNEQLAKQSDLAEEHLHEVKQEHEKQEQRYQNDQHQQYHQVFKTSTYEQFKNFNLDRVDGTCQWVLSHSQYIQWYKKLHDDLLWISADPGCGKSVLAKSLVDHELRSTDQHTVCYFFFKDNEQQDNVATALCALLHQLFSHQSQLLSHAIPAWEKTGKKLVKEVSELWRILVAAARDPEAHDIACVLDALDECQPADRRWLIEILSRFYTETSATLSTAEFQQTLHDLPMIRLRGEEENDQIHQEIDLGQMETQLLEMEHRTYLWLHLAIEDIKVTYQRSFRLEEASIVSLPTSVEDTYEKILNRIAEQQRNNAKKILQIVVGTRRPLHIEEMAIALGIATSTQLTSLHKAKLDSSRLEKHIRDWCGLFVFINHNRIYLIHQTAKEFLISESGCTTFLSGWKNCLNPREIEREITQIYMEFLSFDDISATAQSLIPQFQKYTRPDHALEKDNHIQSLLVYSAEHWPSHLREVYLPNDDTAVDQIFGFYQVNSRLYHAWFPIFWQATRPYDDLPKMSPIRLGGLLGHENILELMLQQKEDYNIDESDQNGRTALIWASDYGYVKVVQMLLEHGADINAQGGYYADVNAQGGLYGNALQAASDSGHEKVVQMLLERGADVNAQGGYYGNALQAASEGGHEKVVQMLLEHGADVNAQGGEYGNALQAASNGGHEKVVQTLLEHGADVNAQGGLYDNSLYAASNGGHEKVVQMLLERGADVNAQGGRYGNALYAASESGLEKVVQILLEHGADINAQGGEYGNVLQAASVYGNEKVVQMLLERGADVNAQGGEYGNALQAASNGGHEKVVQMLLECRADVNAQGGRYGNTLQAASEGGHDKVVQILRDKVSIQASR
ncbi:hypothetical protein DV736_g4876, partial [Chaetothyriales sp. CBS 134916]